MTLTILSPGQAFCIFLSGHVSAGFPNQAGLAGLGEADRKGKVPFSSVVQTVGTSVTVDLEDWPK